MAKAYMNQYLSKYDGITFSKLISLHDHYMQTSNGISLDKKIKLENDSIAKLDSEETLLRKNTKLNLIKIQDVVKRSFRLRDSVIKKMSKMIELETAYKGVLKGYKLYYTYKLQVKFEPVYHKTTFKMDTLLTHITSVKDTIIDEQNVSWK